MPMLRGIRTLNSVAAGTTLAAALETLLADGGRKDDFVSALSVRTQARRAANSTLTVTAVAGSARAFDSMLLSPTAVDEFASNPNAFNTFKASAALMTKISASLNGLKRWIRQWPWAIKSPAMAGTIWDMAYGAGLYVAVGAGGLIRTSPDLVTWTTRTSGTAQTITSVCFGGGNFAAVGTQGTVLTSPDGINWTARTLGVPGTTDRTGYKVAYGNGKWVASWVRSSIGSYMAYTADITNWSTYATISTVNSTDIVTELAFGNGMFVVGGQVLSGFMWYSADGITWTRITPPGTSLGAAVSNVAFDSATGIFVAKASVSNAMALFMSFNGITWTRLNAQSAAIPDTTEKTVAYNGAYFYSENTGQAAYIEDYVNGNGKSAPGLGGLTTPKGWAMVNGNIVFFGSFGVMALY